MQFVLEELYYFIARKRSYLLFLNDNGSVYLTETFYNLIIHPLYFDEYISLRTSTYLMQIIFWYSLYI